MGVLAAMLGRKVLSIKQGLRFRLVLSSFYRILIILMVRYLAWLYILSLCFIIDMSFILSTFT